MAGTRFIVLLRGVNVGGRALPMAALREAARAAGFPDCVTYIQSGNLVLSAEGNAAAVEKAIETLIQARFAMRVEAIARTARDFAMIAAANPFEHAAPKMLHLGLTKHPPRADAAEMLALRARSGERLAMAGGALWIDFGAAGVAASKLMPAVLDKAVGSTLTARNWNTVAKLIELAAA